MTRREVNEQYNIPISVLEEYESWGLCGAEKTCGAWLYDDTDLEQLGMVMTLYEIGFQRAETEQYMRLLLGQGDSRAARLRMLEEKRKELLAEIHFQERQLSKLDFWRYQLRNEKKE